MAESEKMLSFAKKVKTELSLHMPKSLYGQKALLSGIARLACSFSIGSNPILSFRTEISSVAKQIFTLLKSLYHFNPTLIYERKMRFDKSMVFVVRVQGEGVYEMLEDLRVYKNLRSIPLRTMVNKDNIRHFCQGLFIAGGSVNAPTSKSYFLEIAMDSERDAQALCKGLVGVNGRFTFKYIRIRDKWMVYLKKSSEISEFLAWLGAFDCALDYENQRAEKDLFNNENRLNICLAHNYSRALKNGEENIADIKYLKDHGRFDKKDAKTQAVLNIRLKDKEASYAEIAERMTQQGNPMTKSGVARIFAKVKDEVRTLKKETGELEEVE